MKTKTRLSKTNLTRTKNSKQNNKMGELSNIYKNPIAKVDFSDLKRDEKREKYRLPTNGVLIIHELNGSSLYKVIIKNLSPGGICCEIGSKAPLVKSEVTVEFAGSIAKAGLGTVKCKVMWLERIKNHPQNNQLIGLEFSTDSSATKLKKIAEYVESILNDDRY